MRSAALVLVLAAAASCGGTIKTSVTSCRPSQLRLRAGESVSEPTGQHTFSMELENVSTRACSLEGYPTVRLRDAHGQMLSFTFRHHGDQVVTSHQPALVRLEPNRSAFVTINKYRCDVGSTGGSAFVDLYLPEQTKALSLRLPGSVSLDYCGPNDPGTLVSVSPIEPTFRATLSF